jgi:hypothetical protein
MAHKPCTVPCQESPTATRVLQSKQLDALDSPMPPKPKTDRRELTPIERAYLVGRRDAGESFDQISRETGVPKTTVIDTVHNTKKRGSTESLPRGGPRKTDARTNRRLFRETRRGPKNR